MFTATTAMRIGMTAEAAGVPGQHFAMHNTAAGQDFAQSGKRGFSSGQHGIPSGIDAISDAVVDLLSIGAACDGGAIGAVLKGIMQVCL